MGTGVREWVRKTRVQPEDQSSVEWGYQLEDQAKEICTENQVVQVPAESVVMENKSFRQKHKFVSVWWGLQLMLEQFIEFEFRKGTVKMNHVAL